MDKPGTNSAAITNTWHSPYACLKPVPIGNVTIDDGFWQGRVNKNWTLTLDTQYQLLESTGRLDNFRRVFGAVDKPFQGYYFNDSDVYKWLEAASWAMIYRKDAKLVENIDTVIDLIARAQDKDGYLDTYFTFARAAERWTNLREKHELYCAGHLIQAAIAHYRVTEESKLLGIAIRLADHIYAIFGPSGHEGTSGHPEIEMALVELYRTTRDARYLELSAEFINRRGYGIVGGSDYIQDHIPLRDMEVLAGHAVRALYLCSGATDLVLEKGEPGLRTALERLWNSMVAQQLYITGGVGARYDGEAFGAPYELPNSRAYAETCAAIASYMWCWRMLQLEGNARYTDLMEWTLYNAILPGVSLTGKEYFYINPLKDDGDHRRQEWFACACCPPNLSRTLAMLPGYIYSVSTEGIWLHLFIGSTAKILLTTGTRVDIQQTTAFPWEGQVFLQILGIFPVKSSNKDNGSDEQFSLFVRMPGWLEGYRAEVKINDEVFQQHLNPGSYLGIHRHWQVGDVISINLPMNVRFIESHPLVDEDYGRVAVARGPILYGLETTDNPEVRLSEFMLDPSNPVNAAFIPDLLDGIMVLHLSGITRSIPAGWKTRLYRSMTRDAEHSNYREVEVSSIPYYAWANREPGAMEVWHLLHRTVSR